MTDNIPVKILNTIQEAGTEIAESGIKTTEQAISTVITGKELVGDIKPMNDEEMARAKADDEMKKQEELAKIQSLPGRNVEEEMKEIVQEKKNEEDQQQKEFLEKVRIQREAEERERQEMMEEPGNVKREQAKRQNAPGAKKKQEPNMTQMSQTSEFKGGKID